MSGQHGKNIYNNNDNKKFKKTMAKNKQIPGKPVHIRVDLSICIGWLATVYKQEHRDFIFSLIQTDSATFFNLKHGPKP